MLRSLSQNVAKRNMTLIYHEEYVNIRIEYGEIVKEYAIPKDTDEAVDAVWNFYTNKTEPNPVVEK